MDEEILNMSIRKFLKQVGVTSQREIEKGINNASAAGLLAGKGSLNASMTLDIAELDLKIVIEDQIKLG